MIVDDADLTPSERGWILLGAIGLDDVEGCMAALAEGEPVLEASGMTALGRAAEWNSERCARALMAAGRDWRAHDAAGNNALDKAAQFDAGGCASAIVEQARGDGDAELVGRALAGACARGSAQAALVLGPALAADPGGRGWSDHGAEAMAWACAGRDDRVLGLLLDAGWDADAKVPRSALVESWTQSRAGRLSGQRRSGSMAALDWAVASKAWDCARLLLSRGARLDLCEGRGATALMLSAQGQSAPLVKALLSRGVDPNQRDAEGATALMWASRYAMSVGNERVTRALLAAGAQPAARDEDGWDALDCFLVRYSSDKDVAALCERIDPRERMARAARKGGWKLPGSNGGKICASSALALEHAARHWERLELALKESEELGFAAAVGRPRARAGRL